MARLHLFEIHDFAWCPPLFRNSLTEFLATSIATFDNYAPIRQILFDAIRSSRAERVVDLCSGSGGPWQSWSHLLSGLPPVVLTDKFPNQGKSSDTAGVIYSQESVDATAVPQHLTGFRTIFTAAHHFRPDTVRRIIDDAVQKKQPIGIFEFTNRSARGLIHVSMTGLGMWLLTPKTGNLTFAKLFLTYVLPLIPLVATFDGIVSALRTYTPSELASLASAPDHDWKIGTVSGNAVPVTYLIGLPK